MICKSKDITVKLCSLFHCFQLYGYCGVNAKANMLSLAFFCFTQRNYGNEETKTFSYPISIVVSL